MIRLFVFIILMINTFYVFAYSYVIDVNIYSGSYIKEINVNIVNGNYDIFSGDKLLVSLSKGETITITAEGKKINIKSDSKFSQTGLSTLKLHSKTNDGVLNIKPSNKQKGRSYDDNISLSSEGNSLKIINNIDIEKYVSGVVEAEIGNKKSVEFYKVQAVACRTYVLRNIKRHFHESYHMCDKEHCQVYYGKCYNSEILKATEQTNHFVIIDKDLNFISAVFHSNCGGQTVNSEHVWTLPSSYLKSIKDTFCIKSKNAVWELKIKKETFLNYLKNTYNFPIDDSSKVEQALSFCQSWTRSVYFMDMPNIHLKNIRADLKLKSTFFCIKEEEDMLVFRGKGFGHGVGLCQEGAMQMIEHGYCYDDIIKFYYTNVYIVSYEDILKLNR